VYSKALIASSLSVILDGTLAFEADPATTEPATIGKYMAGNGAQHS
jgi:hypothetical protein